MYAPQALSRTFFFTILLGLLTAPGPLLAQNQTNDPLVDEQQYLFDVHNVDQAWSYTTGSSTVRIGVYSFLGFTSNHEDLNGPRLQTPRGPLRPEFDYATEVVGIAGAVTNNSLGVAGIDRASELQSYSMLRTTSTGHDDEKEVTVGDETFYLDLHRFADRVQEGRNNGVDVHLSLIGVPTGLEVDFEDEPIQIDTTSYPPFTPHPDSIAALPGISSGEAAQRREAFQTLKDLFLNVWTEELCFGSGCTNPPSPTVDFRQAVGNATRLDGGIVVTPTGDLDGPTTSSNLPVSPGRLERYVVTVGGLEYESGQGSNLIKWERSNAAPYVDVAGFATGLAGPAAMDFSAYNTEFTSTAGAAAIGTGVASLLRAENPNLTSEDVEQILRRTAKDVGSPGFDNATGAGRIDAGAALAYVRNNDVQRSTQSPSSVTSTQTVSGFTDIALTNSGYMAYSPSSCSNPVDAVADLKKFRVRIPYVQTFSSTPDVWVRWGGSDGYQTSRIESIGVHSFDQFGQDLKVVDITREYFVVEGYYWVADFYNELNQKCASDQPIPKTPSNFNVAYTAGGTEGPPPVEVTISGPSQLDSGESGTWTANVNGGAGSLSYQWYEKYEADNSFSPVGGATSASYSSSYQGNVTLKVEVIAANSSDSDTHSVTVDCGQFCTQSIGGAQSLRAQTSAVPDTFALHASRPNPVRSTGTVRVDLPEASRVEVTVYDVMGRRVAQLVNRRLTRGRHPVHIEATTWPSGVYFVRMQAGSFAAIRRVSVVR